MAEVDERLLKEVTDRLIAALDPEQVILFGSWAWGTPNENSDLDLFVIVKESSEGPLQRNRRARECLRDIPVSKDVLVRTRAEAERFRYIHASLECQVFEEGRVLYDQRQG